MYRCENCGEIFLEEDKERENIGECMGVPVYQIYPVCPHCKSNELTQVDECKCGNFKDVSEDWCDECKNARDNIIESALHELQSWLLLDWKDVKELASEYFQED